MKRILLTKSTHTNFNPFVPSTWQPSDAVDICALRSSDARMAVISSVAKSAVAPRNWATLTLLPQVVFHVRGLKRPQ